MNSNAIFGENLITLKKSIPNEETREKNPNKFKL